MIPYLNKLSVTAVLMAATLLWTPAAGAAKLEQAQKWLAAGHYARAETAFGALVMSKKTRLAALLGIARVQLATGRQAAAVRAAGKVRKGKLAPVARTLAGEALMKMGKLKRAEKIFSAVLRKHPQHFRARVMLGVSQRLRGKMADSRATFFKLYDDFDAGKIDSNSAEQLTYVAMSCRYTDNFRDASDTFADAVKADAKHVEALMQWAEISLEKYEAGHAEQHYMAVLKVNPRHVGALIGMARVKLTQSNDVKGASSFLDQAHKVNPFSIDARVIRAEMLLNADGNHKAEAMLTKALVRNPRHLDALSMMATSFYLRDDLGSFERMRAKVLKLNPRYTAFYRTVVRLAVRHHRYAESTKLSMRAIKIDPKDWYSLADLGTNYLRMGEDKKGLKYLREAWKGDRYNVRTYNLLNLFEDVLAKEYTFIRTKNFRLRVHKTEKELLSKTVAPVLERAFATYARKYRFKPKTPVVIELFKDRQHYAVRTVGLPGLGALGVCFGQVVTAISPTNGMFNWGQVLWHELNHVFTIQLSRSRVPRWLTEGLAEMEPLLHRPEWRRERDFQLYQAMQAGRLRSMADLSLAFTQARNMLDMEIAYFQGYLTTRFLVKHYGLPRVLKALKAFGKGKRTVQLLPAMTGASIKELDRRFLDEQRQRLGFYARNWSVSPGDYRDLDARQKKALAHPGDPDAQTGLAAALLVAGKSKAAQTLIAKVLARNPKNRLGLYVAARLAMVRRDKKTTRAMLQRLVAAGGDGFKARSMLGRLALERKDLPAAARHLEVAKKLDPEQPLPHMLLARAYDKAGKTQKAIAQYKGYVRLDQHSFTALTRLLTLMVKVKDHAGVRKYGLMAYYVHPGSGKLHTMLADAYEKAAPKVRFKAAIRHLGLALLCSPKKPADLHVRLARIHLARKDRIKAKHHVEEALGIEPAHAGALALQKKLP